MKAIILAAGMGARLRPLTNEMPKCMVNYQGKLMIDVIIEKLNLCHVSNISIVTGFKSEVLINHLSKTSAKYKFYYNKQFDRTNMVASLFCASSELDETDDLIISYADIIYSDIVLKKLIASNSPISIVIDKDWRKLWSVRMENPLDDAETLKLDSNSYVIELGKKAKSYSDIQGQYIGLIKIKAKSIHQIKTFYNNLDKNAQYDGKDFDNMYMTSFLQIVNDNLIRIKAVPINGNWLEIDSIEDLENYKKHNYSIA